MWDLLTSWTVAVLILIRIVVIIVKYLKKK